MQEYLNSILNARNNKDLEELRIKFLGKNGIITEQLKNLSKIENPEIKKAEGKKINEIKNAVENALKNALNEKKQNLNFEDQIEKIDYSYIKKISIGQEHIISKSIEKLHDIFAESGFYFQKGPDVESVFYNFEALNIPKEHPARDNNDTFYISNEKILRTHTTCVQIRLLEQKMQENKTEDEIRSYSIGRVYRNDSHDATHACSFHQIEGVVLEKEANLAHLKGFLEHLLSEFFEQNLKIRFRPSYFPFTEPSYEIDIPFNNKYMEVAGCGSIHPKILQNFEQKDKQAFAFGMGLERIIMIKYGITNLHDLYHNHIPVLQYISK